MEHPYGSRWSVYQSEPIPKGRGGGRGMQPSSCLVASWLLFFPLLFQPPSILSLFGPKGVVGDHLWGVTRGVGRHLPINNFFDTKNDPFFSKPSQMCRDFFTIGSVT